MNAHDDLQLIFVVTFSNPMEEPVEKTKKHNTFNKSKPNSNISEKKQQRIGGLNYGDDDLNDLVFLFRLCSFFEVKFKI